MADKPALHGRDHRPDGADPLKSGNTAEGYLLAADGAGATRWDAPTTGGGGIQFETDNVGGWLDIRTNSTDANNDGMHFVSSNRVTWTVQNGGSPDGDYTILSDNFTVDASDGTNQQILLHGNLVKLLSDDVGIQLDGSTAALGGTGVLVQATTGKLDLVANDGSDVTVRSPGTGGGLVLSADDTVTIESDVNGVRINIANTYPGSGGASPYLEIYQDTTPLLVIDPTTSPPTYLIHAGSSWSSSLV